MTPTETQNESIAKELGWVKYPIREHLWLSPKGDEHQLLPNFLEQINVAIAEDLGWKVLVNSEFYSFLCSPQGWEQKPFLKTEADLSDFVQHLPNYCADLNAMHEAIWTLQNSHLWHGFQAELFFVVHPSKGGDRNVILHIQNLYSFQFVNATALQRAIAYCRTRKIGPWKE